MPTRTIETQENKHLAEILTVIEQRIQSLKRERIKGNEELVNYRKYMWEDAALFDRAERVQSENVALTQEQAVLDVAVRLKRLNTLSSSPYFGRIDFLEVSTTEDLGDNTPAQGEVSALQLIYIGLHGLFDDMHNLIIYDWRAPVCGMFYDYEVGPAEYVAPGCEITGDLLLKRQFKIENGRMLYMLDSSLAINDEVLRDALAKNTSEKMKQIVNSIQKEQNAIIRNEDRKILIVQGPAGSGKTSIAMHRAAYLLYRHRGHIAANNLLIFSPNEVFADYISNVLPELGEENIREATFDDFARSVLGKKVSFESKAKQMEFILSNARDSNYALRTDSIAFKSSPAFLRILRSYARHLAHSNLKFTDLKLNDITLLPGSTIEKLYREHCSELPIIAGLERLKDRVLARVTYSSEVVERKIMREVDKVLVDRDAVRLYRKLFKDFHLVQKLAEEDLLPENLHGICNLTYKSLHGKRMNYEDVAPILLLKRLIEGEPRYANVRHLIIDEAQDYTPVHFEIIRNLFGGSSLTILGDLSQQINSYSGIENYDALTRIFGTDARSVVKLTKSYRSSQEITEFASSMLSGAETIDNVRRSGQKPTITSTTGQDQTLSLISAEINKLQTDGMVSIAVICKTAEEALKLYSKLLHKHDVRLIESDSITFHHGLVVLPVYLAKGLEFDAVIIHDAGDTAYTAESEQKLLYTACTRALHSLTLYFTGEPSPLLPMDKKELFEYRLAD